MDGRTLTRSFTGVLPLAVLSLLLLGALVMMTAATQNSALFGRMYSLLLVANILGIILLIGLIVLNLLHLIEQYRARVMGTRLTVRLLVLFVTLAVLPVTVVYFFSIQTLHRGIDNWFDVKIEQALDDALLLGRTALDALKQDLVKTAQEMAIELESIPPSPQGAGATAELSALNYLREQHGVTELTLFGPDARIIASSSQEGPETGTLIPERPSDAVLAQARQGLTYANLDAVGRSGLRLRVVVPVYSRDVAAPLRLLQVLQALPPRYTKLGESVQNAFAEYEKLIYLRGPLKFGFTLMLSLVALLTMLISVWAAIFSARRLVAPIRDLAEGTRAVAQGDYRKQIPVTSRDEIGVLVESFNDMTRRIHRAQSQIRRSQQEAEIQRAYLETVLTHLSSGVLTFDQRYALRTFNAAAGHVLGVDLEPCGNEPLATLGRLYPRLAPLVQVIRKAMEAGESEWRAEVVLANENGRRTLMLRGTLLPGIGTRRGGYVVVFDDVSALIQAQRNAAWAEVARRMAHEIKNPLTPIQLSAERIRHKYLRLLPDSERSTLERATHTIVEQVEALKTMVNAFSDYARPAQLAPADIDLNGLIRDVVELYRSDRGPAGTDTIPLRAPEGVVARDVGSPVMLRLELAAQLPSVTADPGRLRQVLHNLLINARDALGETARPVISLGTRCVSENGRPWVELQVRDNGPGFPAPMLERLFEPYVTNKERGTGLGLAIVKRIVEEHAGSIRAENLRDGGACVTILLPRSSAEAAADSERQTEGPLPAARRSRSKRQIG